MRQSLPCTGRADPDRKFHATADGDRSRKTSADRRIPASFLDLSLYIALRLVQGTGLVLVALAIVGFLLDAVEQLRRLSDDAEASLGTALLASGLRLPHVVEQLLPFAMLFGALLTFQRLTRSNELVAARAAGVSVWQFLLPAVALAATTGLLAVAVLNPIAAALFGRYETLQRGLSGTSEPAPVVAPGGLWLKQVDGARHYVINARSIADADGELRQVVIFVLDGGVRFVERIDAARAELSDGSWRLVDAVRTRQDGEREPVAELVLPSNLSRERIEQSFRTPQTISFWELPAYTELLRSVGFPIRSHVLHFQSLLAKPLLLCAMLIVGTVFSLRYARRGGAWYMLVAGLVAGFAFYALSDIVLALGLSGRVPAVVAAWTPGSIAILLGVSMLFYLEDG